MFVTNWISTTKIQKISEITNFFRHYFLSRTEVSMAKKETNTKSFILRIDSETMSAIEAWAEDEFRSTNGQLQWIIAEALRKAGRLPKKKKAASKKSKEEDESNQIEEKKKDEE